MADKFQEQRFELKYLVSEAVALGVRDFVRSYLDPDEFSADRPNFSYAVYSLYLDSDDFITCHWTTNGDKNRFKLRLRYYDNREGSPVFFELKRRTDNTISKVRGGVRRSEVARLLAGHLPDRGQLLSKNPRQLAAVQRFSHLMQHIQAHPKAIVAYLREAWVSREDNSVRVTIDREVRCCAELGCSLPIEFSAGSRPFGKLVIVELKFTNRFPDWFRDLVRTFNLVQCGAAKYVQGVTGLREFRHVLRGPRRVEDGTAFLRRVGEPSVGWEVPTAG
jgi:VTC domain